MPKAKTSRKQLFRAALAIAGMTAEQWSSKNDVTSGHLSRVLSGERESQSLTDKLDEFIEKHRNSINALAS